MTIKRLRLTPMEILISPLTTHIRARLERLLFCPHGSPYFNPRIEFFKACKAQIKIVFTHEANAEASQS
jgi:hypothetical protein